MSGDGSGMLATSAVLEHPKIDEADSARRNKA
jgi:hypothetical protein